MQSKIRLRVYLIPVKMAKITKQMISYACEDVKKGEQLFISIGNTNLFSYYAVQWESGNRFTSRSSLGNISKGYFILLQGHLFDHLYCCSNHNSQYLETL